MNLDVASFLVVCCCASIFLAFAINKFAFVSIILINPSSLAIDVAKIDANVYCKANAK